MSLGIAAQGTQDIGFHPPWAAIPTGLLAYPPYPTRAPGSGRRPASDSEMRPPPQSGRAAAGGAAAAAAWTDGDAPACIPAHVPPLMARSAPPHTHTLPPLPFVSASCLLSPAPCLLPTRLPPRLLTLSRRPRASPLAALRCHVARCISAVVRTSVICQSRYHGARSLSLPPSLSPSLSATAALAAASQIRPGERRRAPRGRPSPSGGGGGEGAAGVRRHGGARAGPVRVGPVLLLHQLRGAPRGPGRARCAGPAGMRCTSCARAAIGA
jgi:hypothetical protein